MRCKDFDPKKKIVEILDYLCLVELTFVHFCHHQSLSSINKHTFCVHITKTRLYSFDPLKPHFYKVKLGFTGVYIIFLISAQKHRLWVLVRTASLTGVYIVFLISAQKHRLLVLVRTASSSTTIYVLSRNMKNIRNFYLKIFIFFVGKFSVYLNRHVFVIAHTTTVQ